jgi:Domain of Unknown Function (DUF1080)
MKNTPFAALIFLFTFCLTIRSGAAPASNTLSENEKSQGWSLLFDGHSLAGWRGLSSTEPGTGWKVIEGAIVRTSRSGDLLTSADFGDFELSIEWKVEEATNSGILYRVSLDDTETYHSGPEYQILDNIKGGDRFDPKHQAGALYDLVAPSSDRTSPVGAWNETRIIVRGWHIEHWLNSEKIVDCDLSAPAGQALIAHSKFKVMANFATFARGHIALQDHDNAVSFRNIKIRELPARR